MPGPNQEAEDLLRDATALVERAKLEVDGFDEPLLIGFRANGAASVYLHEDLVYHFNSAGELRSAHFDGQLLKAESGQLVGLTKRREAGEVQLVRKPLVGDDLADFLATAAAHLTRLAAALDGGHYRVAGQVPEGAEVVDRIAHWLAELPSSLLVADKPNVA